MLRWLGLAAGALAGFLLWTRLRRRPSDEAEIADVAQEPVLGKPGGEVDPELLEILACPLDKAKISREGDWLVCSECARRYPIRDGIPIMLVEEAVLPESSSKSDL